MSAPERTPTPDLIERARARGFGHPNAEDEALITALADRLAELEPVERVLAAMEGRGPREYDLHVWADDEGAGAELSLWDPDAERYRKVIRPAVHPTPHAALRALADAVGEGERA